METKKADAIKWLRENHPDHPMLESWENSTAVMCYLYADEKTRQQQEIIRRLRAVLGEAYRERKEIYETDKATINWFDVKKPSWLMLAESILKELE